VWYKLLLACASSAECQATLDEQLPGIVQQLQDSGHGTAALELAREVARARVCEADQDAAVQVAVAAVNEAKAVLNVAKADVAAAQVLLQQQMDTDRQRMASVPGTS
jgi:copper(I)-binding protein